MDTIQQIYKDLGIRLRTLREMKGVTQADLARGLGLTRTPVVNIEAGRQRIMLHDIPAMAKVFKVSPEAFLREIWT